MGGNTEGWASPGGLGERGERDATNVFSFHERALIMCKISASVADMEDLNLQNFQIQ